MYAEGQGIPQDYRTARGWYEKAAAQGYVLAEFQLGRFYDAGMGARRMMPWL
jgi:TPR repeat protein